MSDCCIAAAFCTETWDTYLDAESTQFVLLSWTVHFVQRKRILLYWFDTSANNCVKEHEETFSLNKRVLGYYWTNNNKNL